MTKKRVAVVGAGFSGLTLAWLLAKNDVLVEIFESSDRAGGLIGTKSDGILVEQAANAMLANQNIETLLNEIGVNAVTAGYRSNKRWIFRGKPSTMPLSLFGLVGGVFSLVISFVFKRSPPKPQESLAAWATRVLNGEFSTYLVSPVFQGIYGTTADLLSANLVLGSIFNKDLKMAKGKLRGSISGKSGMQEIIDGLVKHLTNKGVKIHPNVTADVAELQTRFDAVVIATSIGAAAALLKKTAPPVSEKLQGVPVLPLASVTLKFESTKRVKGFGCLFPNPENFSALGVLFPSDIFPNRGDNSETWITTDVLSSDEKLLAQLSEDHGRLAGTQEKFERYFIKRWPLALPLYGQALETLLAEKQFSDGLLNGVRITECKPPTYLTGNYLGVIGLAKILDYNFRLSNRILRELK